MIQRRFELVDCRQNYRDDLQRRRKIRWSIIVKTARSSIRKLKQWAQLDQHFRLGSFGGNQPSGAAKNRFQETVPSPSTKVLMCICSVEVPENNSNLIFFHQSDKPEGDLRLLKLFSRQTPKIFPFSVWYVMTMKANVTVARKTFNRIPRLLETARSCSA